MTNINILSTKAGLSQGPRAPALCNTPQRWSSNCNEIGCRDSRTFPFLSGVTFLTYRCATRQGTAREIPMARFSSSFAFFLVGIVGRVEMETPRRFSRETKKRTWPFGNAISGTSGRAMSPDGRRTGPISARSLDMVTRAHRGRTNTPVHAKNLACRAVASARVVSGWDPRANAPSRNSQPRAGRPRGVTKRASNRLNRRAQPRRGAAGASRSRP